MRIGIVGNNLYGQVFLRAARAAGADVVALCPELEEAVAPFAAENGLRAYESLPALLEAEQPDAVMLASVTAHHETDALAALTAGAHVLVDRPLALNLAAADRMLAAAATAGRILMVGHVLQFWPEYVRVREMVLRGDIGRPRVVAASRVSGLLNPAWQQRLLGASYGLGGLEAHTHDIDFLCGLLGKPEVIGATGTRSADGAWRHIVSLLRFGDCRAGVEADYGVPLNYPLSMTLRIVGEEAALLFEFRGGLAARQNAGRHLTLYRNGAEPAWVDVPQEDAYTNMVKHFVQCTETGEQPVWCSAVQARRSLKVLLDIAEAV